MFNWFNKTKPAAPQPARIHAVPEGMRIYAVGDIHGRRDLLDRLIELIIEDVKDYTGRALVVFLGDYIDRGADSKGVLERLRQPLPAPLESLCLLGNHEIALLGFLETEQPRGDWLRYGGLDTLLSYAIPLEPGTPTPDKLLNLQSELRNRFPDSHLQWLKSLPTFADFGDYHFVHAGIRPGVALDQQTDHDRMWMRRGWVDYEGPPFEKMIVHGHTITEQVDQQPYRIGIDTGAYATGHLTALVLEGTTQRVIQT